MTTKEDLEHQKLQHEIEEIRTRTRWQADKAEREIEQLRRPWYRSASFYSSVSPVLLAVAGLVFSWASGWFDTQNKKLEAENKSLEAEGSKLEAEKILIQSRTEILQSDTKELEARKAAIAEQIAKADRERSELQSEIARLKTENETMDADNERLRRESSDLASRVSSVTSLLELKEREVEETRTDAAEAKKRERTALDRVPIITALEMIRADPSVDVTGAAAVKLASLLSPGAVERDFGLDQLKHLTKDESVSGRSRATFLALQANATGDEGSVLAMLGLECIRFADLRCVRSLCACARPKHLLAALTTALDHPEAGPIGLSELCAAAVVHVPPMNSSTPSEELVLKAVRWGRRRTLEDAVYPSDRTYSALIVGSFSPFISACAIVSAYQGSENDQFRQECEFFVPGFLNRVIQQRETFPKRLIAPSSSDVESMETLTAWLVSKDPALIKAACEDPVESLAMGERRHLLFVHAAD